MKTLGPSFTDLCEMLSEILKELDRMLEEGREQGLLDIATTAKDLTNELLFNLQRLTEYLEEEEKQKILEKMKKQGVKG